MTPPNKLLHNALAAVVAPGSDTYEMLFVDGTAPNLGDAGIEFESDITGTITHRQVVTGITFVDRYLAGTDFTINDPGGATVAKYAYLIRQGGGGAATNRILGVMDITDVVWDGVDDQFQYDQAGTSADGNGIWKVGA